MERTFDFNALQRPTLLLTMPDEAHTQIKVSTPNEALVTELTHMAPELERVLKSGEMDAVAAVYDLAARLISCNRSLVEVTADDLRNKYNLDLESLVLFFSAYTDFLNEIANAKN